MVQWPGMSSRTYFVFQHVAGLCLGTIQARQHVQLALACQRSMILAQSKLRLTVQHVYGHGGNLGNECADHAAAFGTFGLTSGHKCTTRWIHHNFGASVCFDDCHSINGIFDRLQRIRTDTVSLSPNRSYHCVHHGVHHAFCALHVTFGRLCLLLLSLFPLGFLLPQTSDGQTFFIRVYRTEYRRLFRAQHVVESSIGIASVRTGQLYFRLSPRGNRPGQDRTFLSLCS